MHAADTLGTIGLVAAGGVKFFRTGAIYVYEGNGARQRYVCLGAFTDSAQAAKISPQLSDTALWHELSPEETLALGRNSWRNG
jgi:hypothetical protein